MNFETFGLRSRCVGFLVEAECICEPVHGIRTAVASTPAISLPSVITDLAERVRSMTLTRTGR